MNQAAGNRRHALRAAAVVAVLVATALGGWWLLQAPKSTTAPSSTAHAAAPRPDYVGSAACATCHAEQQAAWQASDHARAMQPADANSVLGDFAARPPPGSGVSALKHDAGAFAMQVVGGDGKPVEAVVSHTFGFRPLQQYVVSLPDGRKQMLGLAWDARTRAAGGQRWYHLFARDGIKAGQVNHWAGNEQNWNYQCADCHTTGFVKGYDVGNNRYDSRWAELSVGCEACHGPGAAHVAWAKGDAGTRARDATQGLTVTLDERHGVTWPNYSGGDTAHRSAPRHSARELTVCARCHARRGQFSDATVAGDALLDAFRPAFIESPLYYADGQQRDEVFTWGSFLQSRMHAAGVTCSDCHEPHRGALRAQGNALCAQCHAPARFDAPAHHHHAVGKPGSACVDCHMPATTYMGVDARRDHSLRVPRPGRATTLQAPDACTNCHRGKPPAWAEAAILRWQPTPAPGYQSFAEAFAAADAGAPGADAALLAVVHDAGQSAIARASALGRLRRPLSATSLAAVTTALDDSDDLVRLAAVGAMEATDAATRSYHLTAALSDARAAIRSEAARLLAQAGGATLAPEASAAFARALGEYEASLAFNADRPEALVARGNLRVAQGDLAAAEADFRAATVRDPTHPAGWVNLADLQARAQRGDVALATLRQGATATDGDATVQHALGLALIRAGQRDAARTALAAAAMRAPEVARFAYVYAVALHDAGRAADARQVAERALARHPWDVDLLMAQASWLMAEGRVAQSRPLADRLRQVAGNDPAVRRLLLAVGQPSG